jgi:hypothetical protein
MITAYSAAAWTGLASTVAGAAATLTGLVFVAVSINLKQILAYPNLPGRAAQTLISFATALLAAVFVLVPGQGRTALGLELAVAGVLIGAGQLVLDVRAGHSDQETAMTRMLSRVFPAVAGCGCLTVAGASLLAGGGGGLYWLVPTFVIAIVSGLLNAWVLLVEIMR